jgi:methionyl-tRNA formyltransferase
VATVYLGTSEFAAAVLERLAQSAPHRPLLAITRPDRPRGRGRRLSSPPVADTARALGIPLEQPASVNDAEVLTLVDNALGAEGGTVVVCAFGALLKEPLLSAHEVLNVHPSLLPRWRGAAPIERAIMAGDAATGVSIMRLTAGLDSGPVCLAESVPIDAADTYGSLSARLWELGGELLLRALSERPPFHEQPEQGVTYAEKITATDRLLDPGRRALELERVVRALHPHVGARASLADGTLLGVQQAAVVEDLPAPAGLSAHDGRLLLGCTIGTLELLVVQPPGGRPMDAADYLRGYPALGRS